MRKLAVESHDGSECFAFRDQTELARSEVMVLAVAVHFGLLYRFQRLFE